MARPYDVIVYGASGFTGTLVSEYLATKYDGKARAILPSIMTDSYKYLDNDR